MGLTAVALLLLMSYVIVDYRARLTGIGAFVAYYLIPAAALAAVLASCRLPLRIRTNLSVSWVAFVLATYAAEVSIRVFGPCEESEQAFAECDRRTLENNGGTRPIIAIRRCNMALAAGLPFDRRSRLEVITDLREAGADAWPGLAPFALSRRRVRAELPDGAAAPVGGISQVSTVFCNRTGEWVVYESDERGFRNPAGLHRTPADIALLGDSFTHALCVADGETFADGIRRAYPRTVNLGYLANGPLLALASLIEYAAPLQPRHVVWFFFEGNDLTNLDSEKGDPILVNYLEGERRGLTDHQGEVDLALRTFAEAELERALANEAAWDALQVATPQVPGVETTWRASPGVRFLLMTAVRRSLQQAIANAFQPPSPPERYGPTFLGERAGLPFDREMFREILVQSQRWVESWGGAYHVVYLPDWQSVADGRPAHPHYDRVMEIFAEVGVPVISMLPVFAAHEDPLRLFDFVGHYASEAHGLIAEEVLRALRPDSPD